MDRKWTPLAPVPKLLEPVRKPPLDDAPHRKLKSPPHCGLTTQKHKLVIPAWHHDVSMLYIRFLIYKAMLPNLLFY